jgi:hypothetical protein
MFFKRKGAFDRRRCAMEACEHRRLLSGLSAGVDPGGDPNPELGSGGTQVQLSANIVPSNPSDPVPTGTVQFFVGTTPISPMEMIYPGPKANEATISFQSSFFPQQDTTVTADYSGDSNYAPSSGTYVEEFREPTFVTLNTSNASIMTGQPETLTGIVNTEGVSTTPTGTVSFKIWDGVDDSSIRALSTQPVIDGVATYVTTSLPSGTDYLLADYSGDNVYLGTPGTSYNDTGAATVTVGPSSGTSVTIARSTIPSSVVAGSSAHGTVTVDVHNTGSKAEKGKFVTNVYLSPDGMLDGSQMAIGSGSKSASIRAGGEVTQTIPIESLPVGLSSGTYTLLVQTTDPSGDSSVGPAGPTISIAAANIAFSEQLLKLSLPKSVLSGAAIHGSLSFRVVNSGNVTSFGSTSIAVFASSGSGIDDGLFLSTTRRLIVKPDGGSTTVTLLLTRAPAGLNGDYQIEVQLTDAQQHTTSVPSGSTVNIAPPTVALRGSILSVTPLEADPGKPIFITLQLINSGNTTAGDPLSIEISLMGPAGPVAVPASPSQVRLAPNRPIRLRLRAVLPAALPAGMYAPTVNVTDANGNSTGEVSTAVEVAVLPLHGG